MLLYPSLPQNDRRISCSCTLSSSLSLSRGQTLFFHCLLRSLFVTALPPLALTLSLLLLIVLYLFIALHLPPSPSFSHAARFFHLAAFIFYPFIFPCVHPPVCVLLQFGSILMFPPTTAVFRAVRYQPSQLGCRVACFQLDLQNTPVTLWRFAVMLYIMHMIMSYHG